MSETILVHFDPASPERTHWSYCNTQGELSRPIRHGTLDDLAEARQGESVVVLLDSRCLHLNHLQLPTRNSQKMLRAIPYALEDDIAEDVDDLHFVFTTDKTTGETHVAGINRHTLRDILGHFQDAGIQPESILPDCLCLGADRQQWCVLTHEQAIWLQTGAASGYRFDAGLLTPMLHALLGEQAPALPSKILAFSPGGEANDDELAGHIRQTLVESPPAEQAGDGDTAVETEIVPIRYNQHPLVVFCGQYKQARPLNLLQGEFKPSHGSDAYLRPWRLVAALGLLWLGLHLGMVNYQAGQLEEKNRQLRTDIARIYKQTFPESKKVVNPRVQMEQKLKQLKRGGPGKHDLMFLLTEAFGATRPDPKAITLQTITYRNQRMEVRLDGNDLQAIETLNSKLNGNPAIRSEIASSSAEKNRVRGSLRIEAASPRTTNGRKNG